MDAKNSFKLIEGTFSPSEAAEVLLKIINDKIGYHNLKILGLQERNDGDTLHSEERIKQLEEVESQVRQLLSSAKSQGKVVEINSVIDIKLK